MIKLQDNNNLKKMIKKVFSNIHVIFLLHVNGAIEAW
jgi:hypothetical protein